MTNTFGKKAVGQIGAAVRDHQTRMMNRLGGKDSTNPDGPRVFVGRTATNSDYPVYPDDPSNTFVVELGEWAFIESPGNRIQAFTPYSPSYYRIATDLNDTYYDEGTVVVIVQNHNKWLILSAAAATTVVIKSGKTVSEDYAYPDGNADTFEVRLDKWSFVETPGEQGATPEVSATVIIAQTFNGQFVHEGADVIVIELVGPATSQWWIIEAQHEYKGVTYEDIEPDDHGEVTLWINGAETTIKLDAWLDWMHGDEAIEENTQVIVRWFQDQAKWIIVQSACEPISESTG